MTIEATPLAIRTGSPWNSPTPLTRRRPRDGDGEQPPSIRARRNGWPEHNHSVADHCARRPPGVWRGVKHCRPRSRPGIQHFRPHPRQVRAAGAIMDDVSDDPHHTHLSAEDELAYMLENQRKWPDHPVICTFAARLPFPLRLADGRFHRYFLNTHYEDPDLAEKLFPGPPWVQIRVRNEPYPEHSIYPPTTANAIKSLYQASIEQPHFHPDGYYEQWVSLETPSLRVAGESSTDQAYHFHRCLRALDIFLRCHNLIFRDPHVYPVTAFDLHPVVFIGSYELSGEWSLETDMYVHPQAAPDYTEVQFSADEQGNKIYNALVSLMFDAPFVRTARFSLRAKRAESILGDAIETILSLQTAMESRLYTVWRLLLVDCGYSSVEVEDRILRGAPYRPLIVSVLPRLLGGRWDTTAAGTPVGEYWEKLYLLRNRIVHGAYEPHLGQAEVARQVYDDLLRFVRERIWEKRLTYPRTALATLATDAVSNRVWSAPDFDEVAEALRAEPRPYYLPWDLGERQKPKKIKAH